MRPRFRGSRAAVGRVPAGQPHPRISRGSACTGRRAVRQAVLRGRGPRPARSTSGRSRVMTRRCGQSCGGTRGSGRGGVIAERTSSCSSRGGGITASGPSSCGARRLSGSRAGGASASGWAVDRARPYAACPRSLNEYRTTARRPPSLRQPLVRYEAHVALRGRGLLGEGKSAHSGEKSVPRRIVANTHEPAPLYRRPIRSGHRLAALSL